MSKPNGKDEHNMTFVIMLQKKHHNETQLPEKISAYTMLFKLPDSIAVFNTVITHISDILSYIYGLYLKSVQLFMALTSVYSTVCLVLNIKLAEERKVKHCRWRPCLKMIDTKGS